MIKPADRTNLIKEYYFSSKLKEIEQLNSDGGGQVINLGIGNPDLSPDIQVIKELTENAKQTGNHGYQKYNSSILLRKAFSKWYDDFFNVKTDPETDILPLIGSKEGILHITMAFVNPGDKVLVPDPGYPAYSSVSKMLGAKVIKYNLRTDNNWYPDLKEISNQNLKDVKLMWINYPNMPTGAPASLNALESIIEFGIRNNILICNDNPYSFILNENPLSILSVPGARDIALELNSLSKSHNMAGWRIGAVFGNKYFIQNILSVKSNVDSGMFLPVQLAAAKALSFDKKWYISINEIYRRRRKIVWQILDLIETEYDREQTGMFVWAKIGKDFKSGKELSDYLLHNSRVFITPGSVFGENGNDYIRISLCTNESKLIEALNRLKTIKEHNNGFKT